MKCLICNGRLKFQNGMYICESCGTTQSIESVFEHTDVFICYTESDSTGRRTRDSIMAQDIYNRLIQADIATFYQRISAENLVEEQFENAIITALKHSKIILMIGTVVQNFDVLLNNYLEYFDDKIIIPVYSEMNVNDLPERLKNLQAINYDAIGTATVLINNIYRLLGKERKTDIAQAMLYNKRHKKLKIIMSIAVIFIVLLSSAVYIIFGTSYVLKSKKYSYAEALINDANYLKAINIICKLGDYDNSKKLLNDIYKKYTGYFSNDDNTFSLYLGINKDLKADIKIRKLLDGKIITAETSSQIVENIVDFQFGDNERRQGSGKLELTNDGVFMIVNSEENGSSIGNVSCLFKFENRSDAPVMKDITKEDIISWVKHKITENEITSQGWELKTLSTESLGSKHCRIKDTDIHLTIFNRDISDENEQNVTDGIVFNVSAPAKILAPDKIGEKALPFIQDGILYVPNGEITDHAHAHYKMGFTYFVIDENSETIDENTPIGIISDLVSPYIWGKMICWNYALPNIKADIKSRYGDLENITAEIEEENDDECLFSVHWENQTVVPTYILNKTNYKIRYVDNDSLYQVHG